MTKLKAYVLMKNRRINDVFEDIKTYPNHFFNVIFSDVPYNLGTEWFISPENGTFQVKGRSKDFMDSWKGLTGPQIENFFQQAFRTTKHGGFCIIYGLDRQLPPFMYYAQKAGFQACQSLYWFYISNFPKSTDVSRKISRLYPMKWPHAQNV